MASEQFGNYRVDRLVGHSSTGAIYTGRHDTLGRSVVVKVLLPELSRNADMVERFFNEAQAATAIRNPGIVHIFDYGVTPEGRAYVVTEQLEGITLTARLEQRRLDLPECCRLGRQIANVMQAAHAAGIIHRDLKPENLFLVPDPEVIGGERVKVLDFGLAKLAGEAQASGVKTSTGLQRGSPSYMSPEQCKSLRTADARSDIYALGCILFEMACGRPPFTGHGMGDIVGAHLHVPPPHPQTLASNVPSELATLLLAMLEKQPDARPQTMSLVSQAIDDIARMLEGLPPRSPQPLPVLAPRPVPVRAPAPLPGLTTTPAAPRPASPAAGPRSASPTARPGPASQEALELAPTALAAPVLSPAEIARRPAVRAGASTPASPPKHAPVPATLPPDATLSPEPTLWPEPTLLPEPTLPPEPTLEEPTLLSDGPPSPTLPPTPTLSTAPTLPRRPAQSPAARRPEPLAAKLPEPTLADPTLLPLDEPPLLDPTLLPIDEPPPPPPSRPSTPLPSSPSAGAPQPWPPSAGAPQPWPPSPGSAPPEAPQRPRASSAPPGSESPQYPFPPSSFPAHSQSPQYPPAPAPYPGSTDARYGRPQTPWPVPPSAPPAAPQNGRAQTPWPVPHEELPLPNGRAQTPWPVPPAQTPSPGYPAHQPNVAAAQRAFLLVGLVLLGLIIVVALIAGLSG